jgi:hypothetical protein
MVSINMQMSQRSQTVATSGSIQGSITDPAGAVVPGAAITITNTGTQASRTFSGLSFYPHLPVTQYARTELRNGEFEADGQSGAGALAQRSVA